MQWTSQKSKTLPAENVHDEEESNTEEKVHEKDKLESKTLAAENMHEGTRIAHLHLTGT